MQQPLPRKRASETEETEKVPVFVVKGIREAILDEVFRPLHGLFVGLSICNGHWQGGFHGGFGIVQFRISSERGTAIQGGAMNELRIRDNLQMELQYV